MSSPQETRDILGANLRLLTELKGSQTNVSHALGIGRVQFGRYLSGQSFPKPDVLKQLCDYFHVDARIVLEPLDLVLLTQRKGVNVPQLIQRSNPEMEEMINFVLSGRNLRVPYTQIPNGIHRYWKRSFMNPGVAINGLMRFYDLGLSRVVRGYEAALKPQPSQLRQCNPREFRAPLIDTGSGFVLIAINTCSSDVSFVSCNYDNGIYENYKFGYSVLAKQNHITPNRFSHYVLEILAQESAVLLSCARQSGYLEMNYLPGLVRENMETPIR